MPRLKCPKRGNVFDASRSFSAFHIGPIKQIKCPACGRISIMRVGVKDPITWSPQDKKPENQSAALLSEEEQEKKRIEESKYEKP